MRCFVVINPRSGAGLDHADFPGRVRRGFAEAGIEAVYSKSPDDDLDAQIAQARDSGIERVAVVGGDGTIMGAAQALLDSGQVLAIIPAGTMNVLAHELGLPLEIPDAIRLAGAGAVRAIDVGEVNGRIFIGNSVLGAPSRLARRREGFRGRSTGRSYAQLVRAGLRALWRYPAMGVTIQAGEEHRPIRTRALAVVVNDYAEGFGKVLTRSSLDGGELVLYALKPITPWRLLGLAVAMLLGCWRHDRRLERLAVDRVTITTRRKRVRLMNDGETLLVTPPLNYRVRPKALRVVGVASSAEGAVSHHIEDSSVEAVASR